MTSAGFEPALFWVKVRCVYHSTMRPEKGDEQI